MKDLNKVFLMGNLVKEVKTKYNSESQARSTFVLATARPFKPEGKDKPETDFHNIVTFGRNAEIAKEYLSKGSRVHVEGRIQTRSWDDKDSGETKYITEIVVEPTGLTMLDGARATDGEDSQS